MTRKHAQIRFITFYTLLYLTSVKSSFPAWKALRVNSPASAGLVPGTLPAKHACTQTKTWKKKRRTVQRMQRQCAQNTHTQSRIDRRARMWLGVHWAWQRTHLQVIKGRAGIVLSTIFQTSLADDCKHKTIWEIEVLIYNKYKLQ